MPHVRGAAALGAACACVPAQDCTPAAPSRSSAPRPPAPLQRLNRTHLREALARAEALRALPLDTQKRLTLSLLQVRRQGRARWLAGWHV